MRIVRLLVAATLLLASAALPARADNLTLLGVSGGAGYLLDQLGLSATAAYSLRQLRQAYSGKAVNIRRASDNATMDIGFVGGGNLDTVTASAFCASTTCFVTKWYDQSGNGNDASQATAANQPQLLLNQTPGGKPAIQSTHASATYLQSGNIASISQPLTLALSAKRTGSFTTGYRALSDQNGNEILFANSANTWGMHFGVDASPATVISDSAFHVAIALANGASSTFAVDGGSAVTLSPGTNAFGGAVPLYPLGTPTLVPDGQITTAIVFPMGLTTAQQNALMASERAYGGW